MKRKMIIWVFSLLILVTAITFLAGAINSYLCDIAYHSDDHWVGFDAVSLMMIGGFTVFYELDLFHTTYYFLMKPKTTTKSILHILANVSLLLGFFTDEISYFLWKYVSQIFGEGVVLLLALALAYIVLRVACLIVPVRQENV